MNNEQKRNQIEESYINGQMEQAKSQFKKLSKTERKEFAIETMYRSYAMEISNHRIKQYRFAEFLINLI